MEPLVSVCCITYNHEKYIKDAIESFLMQKTNFPIEIIIHDDASTDNTAKIIREYEKEHPDVIKPIYQTENQYSRGRKILHQFVSPMAKGKYIATCEGDDFWTDPQKLQKQVDFLESHENYSMCFHAVAVIDTEKNFLGRYLGPYGRGSKEYTIKNIVRGGVVHVSSRVIRAKYYKGDRPKWISNARHGDYATALHIAAKSKVYFIDEVMSSYRTGVENSMMTNFRQSYTRDNDIKYHMNRIETLNMADKYYNYKYHDEIQQVNLISEVIIKLLKNDYGAVARLKYKTYIKKIGVVSFVKLLLLKKFPNHASILIKLKRMWILHKT